jgi:hypothetical protein
LGDVQDDHTPSSRRHSNVVPDSEEENSKLALREGRVPEGPDVIEVWGAVVSTVRSRRSKGDSFPAASSAQIEIRQGPSLRTGVVYGEVQLSTQ